MYPLPPDDTELGHLEIDEVFDYFDFPQTFSCRSASRHAYVAFHVEEPPQPDTWLYVRTSDARLAELVGGRMEAREALLRPEDGFVYRVIHESAASPRIDHLPADKLPDDWIPPKGERLAPRKLAPPLMEIVPGETARTPTWAFAHVRVINHGPLAQRVQAWATFREPGGVPLFQGREMPARWSAAPEPVTPIAAADGTVQYIPDPSKLPAGYVQDFAREEPHALAVAIRFADGVWGWTPDSYFHGFKHRDWPMPRGVIQVDIRVRSDGVDYRQAFELDTSAPVESFGLRWPHGKPATFQSEKIEPPPEEQRPPRHLSLVEDAAA